MTTKLTLSIDKDVITSAKKYAERSGKSLSGLVENYLKLVSANQQGDIKSNPKVKNLRGSLKIRKDIDYKIILASAIEKRFSK